MWKIFSQNTVSEIQSENQHNLVWSLKPIFYCLAVFGIDLDVLVARSAYRRYSFITLGIMYIVFTQALNIHNNLFEIKIESFHIKSTKTWLTFLKLITWGAWYMLFPPTTFYSYLFKWKILRERVENLENFMSFQRDFHLRLRKFTTALAILTIVMVNNVFLIFFTS